MPSAISASQFRSGKKDYLNETITYEELCSFETLLQAFRRSRRGKRGKRGTAAFEFNALEELLILSKSLLRGTIEPDPLDAFLIFEPKKRLIHAPTFRDKVVQHAMTDAVIYDTLRPSFSLTTYAAQYGKGTHFGLEMLEKHLRRYFLQKKGADEEARRAAGLPYQPQEEWDYADGFVIKGDIYHFFQSIDHNRLKKVLRKRFPDQRTQALMWKYIDSVEEGLALGHQTSHIYAMFFVSSIMHFAAEKLHLPLSGMYMDDWYIICPDKQTAQTALQILVKEFADLGLSLNNKTNIFPLQNGIDFCGFHTYLTKTGKVVRKLRRSSIKRMKRRIRKWEAEYAQGKITREKIMESYQSWEAHAKHGDTRQLRIDMRSRLEASLRCVEEQRRLTGIGQPATAGNRRREKQNGTAPVKRAKRQLGQTE